MSTLRVVTAQADELKVAMLVAAGLQLVQQWWVKPIEATEGPVLLADGVSAGADLSVLEDEAARMGSVLVVAPTEPDSDREPALQDRAWTVASQWYVGKRH